LQYVCSLFDKISWLLCCCLVARLLLLLQDATKGTNTTLLIPAKISPINGTDLAGLVSAISGAQPPILNLDICAYVNCPADVLKLYMNFNSDIAALQSVLTTRVVRRRMAKMTVKVSRNAPRRTTKLGNKLGRKRTSKKTGPKKR
jgi:hypothetical protein